MPLELVYPNELYSIKNVDTAMKREYLQSLADVHNMLWNKGYSVVNVEFFENDDGGHIEASQIQGDYIEELAKSGVISGEKLRALREQATGILDDIAKNEDTLGKL